MGTVQVERYSHTGVLSHCDPRARYSNPSGVLRFAPAWPGSPKDGP